MTTPTTEHSDDSAASRSPVRNEIFLGFVFAIGCATLLAIFGDLRESQNTQVSTPEMFRLSNALVTGALGFFAGRASAWAQQRYSGRGGQPGTTAAAAGAETPNP